MGQPITVIEKPSSNPAVLRFETNRPLSGMGHEGYDSPPAEILQRPVDELARRLFAAGGVQRVHINGSVVTVTLGGGRTGAGLGDVVRNLFLHYGEQPAADDAAAAAVSESADGTDEPAGEELATAERPADAEEPAPAEPTAAEPAASAESEPAVATEPEPAADAAGTKPEPEADAAATQPEPVRAADAAGTEPEPAADAAGTEPEPVATEPEPAAVPVAETDAPAEGSSDD